MSKDKKFIIDDVLHWAATYNGPRFHALLTDPPYHLTSITKRFGKSGSAPAKYGKDGAFQRASKGFMGKQWDGGDIAFRPETWIAIAEHLYPGAFGMSFASSRGWHRLACAIEDAGLIIHPTIFGWAYGSGFPKATRIDNQIDRNAGAEREIVGIRQLRGKARVLKGNNYSGNYEGKEIQSELVITKPSTELAKAWAGHRYGLQALKPALEPIIVFQKPYEGRPLDNITQTGAGALNIDGARIPTDEPYTINTWDDNTHPFGEGAGNPYTSRQEDGRWPANFILLDDGAAEALDRQSGVLKSGIMKAGQKRSTDGGYHGNFPNSATLSDTYGDSGGASRFFFHVQEQIDEADPVFYCAKASRSERDAGLEDFPIVIGKGALEGNQDGSINKRTKGKPTQGRNIHPTVKPINLTRYLATLLLPPQEYSPRRILIPFAGVASEVIGALQAGWEGVIGIELEEENKPIALARIKYWNEQKSKT